MLSDDFDVIEQMLKMAMAEAAEKPGPFGGRYVARRYNKQTKRDDYAVMADDDPEKFFGPEAMFSEWDILAQCTPTKAYGIGHARNWINLDGTVDREFFAERVQ